MKTTAYRERDYTFGQAMLNLRTEIGLTQAGLAQVLGVSRRAVGEWEAGVSHPKTEHLKELIALAVKQQAFPAENEAEEIRALWKAAHQKIFLDERWLSSLLLQQHSPHLHLVPKAVEESIASASAQDTAPAAPVTLVDWGEALAVLRFYGREEEQAQLIQWIVQEHCRVVSVLGMGGIGKSALAVSIMHQLVGGAGLLQYPLTDRSNEENLTPLPDSTDAGDSNRTSPNRSSSHRAGPDGFALGTAAPFPDACPFEVVIFRSLRDAPSCEALLDDCLQVLSPQLSDPALTTPERRISLIIEHLRKNRVLLVLDNWESLLEGGDPRGRFRPGFESYGQLLRRVAETSHQSCLLITSREKPAGLRLLEGSYSQVRTLRLTGLDVAACKLLLEEKGVAPGAPAGLELESLIEAYSGNPLALKIVAETIVDLFGGEIGPFLSEDTLIFDSITDLLDEQFARLSALEQCVLCWLAIGREPLTLDELQALLVSPIPRIQMLEAIESLRRRSLIEPGKRPGSFTLQSVVLEYVTAILIVEGSREIQQHRLDRLIEHGLSQAHAKEYVRQTQTRLLVSPLLAELQSLYMRRVDGVTGTSSLEERLLSLLEELRKKSDSDQGYGPANLIALLRLLRGNLNALDLSHLCIRGVYLQGIEMQDATLAGSLIQDCVWTSAVDVAWSVALSGNGKWWASGGIQGQVRIWKGVHPHTLHLNFQAHTDFVYTLAFSPDGRTLASGSQDGTIKLWEVESGVLLWTAQHSFPLSLAFSPDGQLLASGELHATLRIWNPQSGTLLQTLTPPSDVWAVAWSPDGSLLASGCVDGEIRLWERQQGTDFAFTSHLSMQTNWVTTLAFSPNGRMLASASWGDQTVKLWEVDRGQLLHTLPGYSDQSRCVAWSPDGRYLSYSNPDKGICFFDVEESRIRSVLHGHNTDICGMAFTPDGTRLFSGSSDGTLCVWDVSDSHCVRVLQGYGVYLYDLSWSPDGTHLMSGDTTGRVTVWDVSSAMPSKVLHFHTWIVEAVGWSPDEQYCASCGLDGILCVWDPTSHILVEKLGDPRLLLLSMAWSPNGKQLACGTYGQGIQVWDATTRSLHFFGQTDSVAFWCVDWSPNGTQLVGGGHDGCLYLWERGAQIEQAQDVAPLKLPGHQSRITCVAWSPNGRFIASGSGTSNNGELFLWDVERAVHVKTLEGHPNMVYALAWSHNHEDQLISAGADGKLYWWDVERAVCVRVQEAHQGTIRSLKVSPDGKQLASCGDDGATKIWDVGSGEHVQTLRHNRPYERLDITGIRGLNEAGISSFRALGAIEETVP